MASFEEKIGWELPWKRENKNYCPVPILHDTEYKIPKKEKKKFRKFKNTIVASVQAIIGLNRPRKRENKTYRSVSFLPDA